MALAADAPPSIQDSDGHDGQRDCKHPIAGRADADDAEPAFDISPGNHAGLPLVWAPGERPPERTRTTEVAASQRNIGWNVAMNTGI